MPCPAYGSTSGMSLFWAVDPDPALALPATFTWETVPMTSESLLANVTASVSERITADRAYSNSTPTKGEVSGSISYEADASSFMDQMLQAVIQVPLGVWAAAGVKTNASTAACLTFLKVVQRGAVADYYVFRGCQIDSLTAKISPSSFITGEISIMGIRPGSGAAGATDGSNDVLSALPAGWTLNPYPDTNIMSSGFAFQGFEVQDSGGASLGVIAQEVTITLANQLRQQDAVGTGSIYSAGVASGRFKATATANCYYSGPEIIDAFIANTEMKIVFDLIDSAGNGWSFLMDKVKPTSAPPPAAGGADQDVMSNAEFQGFQSLTHGTIEITKVP